MSDDAANATLPPPARPLKVGLFLPCGESMLDGGTPRWSDLRTMARLAEEVGFNSLWFGDHLHAEFSEGRFGFWECWSVLAALAAVTRRVTLGPLVACAGYRNRALLAKMADTVNEISGGRLVLGLGAGWHEPEYRAFGVPFDHRAGRFEEALRMIQPLLREGKVNFAGQHYRARDCELRPRGPRPGGPPILIGADGPRMLRLTARYADAWNADWLLPEALPALQAAVNAACREVGRDPATLARTCAVRIDLPGVTGVPFGSFGGQAAGSPAELAGLLRAYAGVGIAHVQILLGPNTPAGVEAFAPVLDLLDRT